MALGKREVEVVTCDSCGKEEILNFNGSIPEGWFNGYAAYSNGRARSAGVAESNDWHACKPAHIKAAVLNATGFPQATSSELD